jgi:hypothetical protein
MQSALDEGRAFKVKMVAASDPATALAIAQQITDPTLRHLAQVSLVPAYAEVHPEQANAWLAMRSQWFHRSRMPERNCDS